MDIAKYLSDMGTRIKRRRESLNLSQESLSSLVGYKSRSSINKIELGKTDIAQSTILKIADALHTTPAYLLGWDNSPEALHDTFSPAFDLTEREVSMVQAYRRADDRTRQMVDLALEPYKTPAQSEEAM